MDKLLRFHKLVDGLIQLNKERRAEDKVNRYYMSPLQYLCEFCTIIVDIGRRAGKSEFIRERLDENSIVVCKPTWAARVYEGKEDRVVYCNYDYLVPDPIKDLYFDTVYIDEPYRVFLEFGKYRLFEWLLQGRDELTVVLLGKQH